MSKDKKRTPTGNYPVGFAAPPEQHRYPKGKSGNPLGRPKGVKLLAPEDIEKLFAAGMPIQQASGAIKKMAQLEVELRKLVQKALNKDLKAIDRLLKKFKKYGLLPEAPAQQNGGVVTLPPEKEMPTGMSKLLITTFGAPPWSAEEIEAIRPAYEKAEADYWATKKEALRSIYRGMQGGKK